MHNKNNDQKDVKKVEESEILGGNNNTEKTRLQFVPK